MNHLVLFLTLALSVGASAELVDRIVAVVNEDIVTESDVTDFERRVKSGAIVDDLLAEDPKSLLGDRAALIEHLIQEKVIDSEVKRKNLSATVERVEGEINKIAAKNGVTQKQLRQALKEQGVNFAEYQDFVKKRLERQSLIEQAVTSKVKVSDEEVAAFYMSQKKSGAGKETYEYTVAHILFVPRRGGVQEAETRALAVQEKLKAGESFESLAAKYSEDPNFSTGGLLGTFRSGEFTKELEQAAAKLNAGETSGLISTRAGVHILKVLAKKIVNDPELDRQKEQIRQFLYQKAFKKQFTFWLEQRRREAFVRINSK